MNNLSLTGQLVKLSPYNEHNNIHFNTKLKNIHTELAIQSMTNEQILGYIYSYNYNKIDSYLFIEINCNDDYNSAITLEACNIFFNYIFTCFPVRKIYYESNHYNMKIMKDFRKIGFKLEANLKKDYFFNREYCDKYILALYSKDFSKGY